MHAHKSLDPEQNFNFYSAASVQKGYSDECIKPANSKKNQTKKTKNSFNFIFFIFIICLLYNRNMSKPAGLSCMLVSLGQGTSFSADYSSVHQLGCLSGKFVIFLSIRNSFFMVFPQPTVVLFPYSIPAEFLLYLTF